MNNKKDYRIRVSERLHRKLIITKNDIFKKTGMSVSLSWIISEMARGRRFRSMQK